MTPETPIQDEPPPDPHTPGPGVPFVPGASGYPRTWAPGPAYGPSTYAYERTPPVEPKPGVDGFAITSLITGLLGGVLFSVGFGIAALVRIGRGKRRGRPLAITGLTLSLVWIIVLVAVVAYERGRRPDRDTSGAVTRQGQVAPADLRVGDCVRVPRVLSGVYTGVTVVPCRQSHNGQVFDLLQASGDVYPGDTSLRTTAVHDCQQAELAFLGTDQTLLHVVAFFPPERSWDIGRRDEHCLLVDRARNITGDIRRDK